MPRASGPGKRQHLADSGNRDSRHDNGLVSPAKRVSAKKSHGANDGPARSADTPAGRAGPSPLIQATPSQIQVNGVSTKKLADATNGDRASDALRRGSVGDSSVASSDSYESSSHARYNGVNGVNGGNDVAILDPGHRQIDVNTSKCVETQRDTSLFGLVATVVRSLPLHDTLAILIILMQVPYSLLSMLYAAFALLTFVPPVTTRTGMNINLAEILDGNSHTPSLVTVLCMDFFFFLIWVFLWQPIQDGLLEFAKPVIAITLGGGTNAKDGTSRGVTTCFTYILLHQGARATRSHWSKLARHMPEGWSLPSFVSSSLGARRSTTDKRSTHSWIQSTMAIHILTQGIVRYVREWYLKRERSQASVHPGDPEAAKSAPTSLGSGSGPGATPTQNTMESTHDSNTNMADAEAGGLSPLHAPTSASLTNRKKRKQSAQVRLQQPLWAAMASTKIVAYKEFELSAWVAEHKDIHNLGNDPFDRQEGRIWISYVGSDDVCFNTTHFPANRDSGQMTPTPNGHATRAAGIDTSKPFYVRINNAVWQPTRISPVQDDNGGKETRWTGDVYGLRPSSKYLCEFVDSLTDAVIFSASIHTGKEPQQDNNPTSPGLPPNQQLLRPNSPATTLRTSIVASETKLADERTRLKTLRKDWKTKANAVRREIEQIENQASSAGNNDDKHRQKIRQQETQKAQAERETETLGDQLKNYDSTPELAEWRRKCEKRFTAEKKLFDSAQKQFKEYNAKLDAEVKAKELDKSNLNTRRNKVATRIAKVENELANIADANTRGLNEAERRRYEHAKFMEQSTAINMNYEERIVDAIATNENKANVVKRLEDELESYSGYWNGSNGMAMDRGEPGRAPFLMSSQQQPSGPWNPNPIITPHYPSGVWGASSSDLMGPAAVPSAQSGNMNWKSPPGLATFDGRGVKTRGRSSSMLSDVSGFTQPSDDGSSKSPPAHLMKHGSGNSFGRNGDGSGGSTGSGSGSPG